MTVTFFGHRQIQGAEDLKGELKRSIEDLIGKGEENITFLCGGYGAFDGLCASLLRELKKKHLHLEMDSVYKRSTTKEIAVFVRKQGI